MEHTVCASIPISKIEDSRTKDKEINLCRLVYDDSVSLPRVVKSSKSADSNQTIKALKDEIKEKKEDIH